MDIIDLNEKVRFAKKALNSRHKKHFHREDMFQMAVVEFLRLRKKIFFCHVPNGGRRNLYEAARFKKMGVLPGMPDILIFNSSEDKVYHGLAIELKVRGNSTTTSQKRVLGLLEEQKWKVMVCDSMDEFIKIINEYFNFKSVNL